MDTAPQQNEVFSTIFPVQITHNFYSKANQKFTLVT